MAERRIIDGNLAPNSDWALTGSTTSTSAWIGGATNKWALNKAGTITTIEAEFIEFDGRNCIKLTATGGASGSLLAITNIVEYPAATVTSAVLNQFIRLETGRSYTVSVDVWVPSTGTNIRATNDLRTYSNVLARRKTTSVNTLLTNQWVTLSQTFTADNTDNYYTALFSITQIVASAWSGEAYFSNPSFIDNTAGARTTATSRTTATNRVAVRDMGTALRFDGVDDFVEIADAGLPASTFTSGFTVSAWINPQSSGESGGRIFDKSTSTGFADGFGFFTDGSGQLGINIASGGVRRSAASSYTLNRPNHALVTVSSGGVINFYVNGVQSGTANQTSGSLAGIITTNPAHIGNRANATDRTFDGIIDEPRIWNRALTADEIQNLYLNNIVPQDGLVAEYLFDEATGTTAIDTSGNGNDGTITGATYTTDVPLKLRTSI